MDNAERKPLETIIPPWRAELMRPIEEDRPATAVTPMDMLNQALAQKADIVILEKLMGLQERWESNRAKKAFDAAVSAAKADIKPITRNAEGHNGKYADFSAIAAAVDPALAAQGLSYRFRTVQADKIIVTCILSHRDGHSEETSLAGPPDTTGSKNTIQAIGSTLTYLQRYTLVQMLGLAAAKDDDGKHAGAGGSITDEQADELRSLALEAKADMPTFLEFFKADSIADISAKDFDKAKRALLAKRSKASHDAGERA